MEAEIDPLSMLEQSMQVNDGYTMTSNVDEDVVLLVDDAMEGQAVTPPQVVASSDPVQSYYQANGSVALDNCAAFNEADFGFGQHFLINPTPDSPPAQRGCDSPLTITWKSKMPRGGRGSRGVRGLRGKTRGRISLAAIHQRSSYESTESLSVGIANSKLVNNVKRLSYASTDEQSYRQKIFSADMSKVLNSRLDCTVCGLHIGCNSKLNVFLVTHPLLKVLTCSRCRENYCNTDWTLGPGNRDTRCRWCSRMSSSFTSLYYCTNCPFAFCEMCIVRNFSKRDWARLSQNDSWLCYVCQMVPLYFMRATCWALHSLVANISKIKTNSDVWKKDVSKCCKEEVHTIDLVEDERIASPIPSESNSDSTLSATPVPISVVPISSRINVLFAGIDSIKHSINTRLKHPLDSACMDQLVSDINVSIAKIGANVESCLQYIENWKTHTVESLKKEEEAKERLQEEKRNQREANQKLQREKQTQQTVNQKQLAVDQKFPILTRSLRRLNGHKNYSELFKKFQIKPCSVVLNRIDVSDKQADSDETPSSCKTETSQPPSFFFSLISRNLSKKLPAQRIDDDISIVEDTDDEIICLDD